jgi:NifU-like protein involved in Fe-S cluster formation
MLGTAAITLSANARARLRKPRSRGAFLPIDAARRQLGLLSVADPGGQARIYWLVDLPSGTIADARFIAFGDATSHPVADAFTEAVRGRSVADAARLRAEQIEILLRDQPGTPAFGDAGLAPLAFLRDLQDAAELQLPKLELLPKPDDTPIYQRKRKADWTREDEAWLPLGLMQKVAKTEQVIATALAQRLERNLAYRVEGLHDDFRVVIRFEGLSIEQIPTVARFVEDALRAQLHPQLAVEAVEAP